ncbi:hypothetical protein GQX74_007124 [Glossina fuscipes]|nr:hypothetical protein GQX74_007124 [Glossina fuscipes]
MAGVKVRFKMIIGFTCSTRQRLVNSETIIIQMLIYHSDQPNFSNTDRKTSACAPSISGKSLKGTTRVLHSYDYRSQQVTQALLKRVDVLHAQQCPDNGTINANVVS